jgi:hypothetical protein
MKPGPSIVALHSAIEWRNLEDLKKIQRLGARCVEVLRGACLANIQRYISVTEIHEVIYLQAGKNFASTPSNISTALRKFDGHLDKTHSDGSMKFRFPTINGEARVVQSNETVDSTLLKICDRFHRAVAHLTGRRKGKHSIDFSDEYDVQDVFGTIIKCCYDDVRDEEWTPSYAGGASRIDFVIKDIETAAELKRARPSQAIADELILDIARYSKNQEVKKLVCFVYDPEGLLRRDATQIEIDLSGCRAQGSRKLDVIVLIRPK